MYISTANTQSAKVTVCALMAEQMHLSRPEPTEGDEPAVHVQNQNDRQPDTCRNATTPIEP